MSFVNNLEKIQLAAEKALAVQQLHFFRIMRKK